MHVITHFFLSEGTFCTSAKPVQATVWVLYDLCMVTVCVQTDQKQAYLTWNQRENLSANTVAGDCPWKCSLKMMMAGILPEARVNLLCPGIALLSWRRQGKAERKVLDKNAERIRRNKR